MTLSEAADRLQAAAIGALKRRQKDRLARVHQQKLASFFRSQKVLVLAALKEQEYLFHESYRRLTEESTELTLSQWDRIWEKIEQETSRDLQYVIFGAEVDGVAQGADQLKRALPPKLDIKSTFNLANPRSVSWFQQNGGSVDRIKGIQTTTGKSLKRVITTSIDEGWSYKSTAREIQKLYDGPISRERAQRIAVFETGQAYEAGNRLFAESLEDDGVSMEERWVTSHDEKVRPEHAANEAEGWVPLGHVYSSGHTDPPTDPGCRCYKMYRQALA